MTTIESVRPGSPQPALPRGVGLLSVLASLACVALVAGLAIPAFFGREEVTLDNAAILLARDVRVVQNRAAHLGQNTSLRFDRFGWQAFDARGKPLSRYASSELIERRLDADAVFEGVTLEAIQFGPDAEIEFDSTGRPARSGSLEVVYRGERRHLALESATGGLSLAGLARPWADEGF